MRYIRPHVAIIGGYNPYSPYLGFGYGPRYGYDPFFGYPPVYRSHRETKLDLHIADIKNDYSDRIWSVKHAKDLNRRERKEKIQQLRHDREAAIIDAKRNYYKTDFKA